nr:MAG: protein of unknown function DUF3799 [Bacteriophage sp.]UWG27090.1 MAG: protein of unknown function (DUF3799) [Bacteriophage sp.]
MMKSLRDISWQVSEEEYRADPALSYSTLARYEREGFNNLDKLFDRIETPSLTFGSAVDSIITGGQEEFDERFMVAEFPSIPDSIVKIIKSLYKQYAGTYRSLLNIPDNSIIRETEAQNYQMNWKPETRAKVIKEKGTDYYNLLFVAGDRCIVDTQTYQDVCNAVRALKESKSTQLYFADDNPFEPDIERLYQLKFKGEFDGITYRNMADLIIVNHKEKWVKPVDLKTSSHTEWDFYKSFVDWRYDIQARLYWAIIRQNMDKDEYFKDFKLLDYDFIVVNKRTLTPLVWNCPFTRAQGTLKFGKNDQIEMRSPFVIGKELNSYLTSRPKVPIGISETGANDLRNWLYEL